MAKLHNGPFDANMFNPTQGMGSLPIGRHLVSIFSTEIKENSNKDGGYVQFNLKAADGSGEQAYRLNLYHSSAQTVDIANKQLSALCHVCGIFFIEDTDQLIGPQFYIEVGKQKVGDYVEVKKVFDINGNEPGKEPTNAPQGGGNQQQQPQNNQQQQPAGNQNGGGGWGGNQNQNQQQAPQNQQQQAPQNQQQAPQNQQQQGGWGNNNQQQQPQNQQQQSGNQQQAPQNQQQGGGWNANQQPQNAGGNPGWGNKG